MLKKIILIICLLALPGWAAVAFGTTYYVDNDRADDTGDGTSWATAKKNIVNGVNLLATSGDILILDDDNFIVSGNIITSGIALAADGSFTIRSRSNDPTLCTITQSGASNVIWGFNEETYVYSYTIQGIGMTNSNAALSYSGAAAWLLQKTGDVIFDNCKFYGFTNSVASSVGAIIRCDRLASGTRTVTLSDCLIDSITINSAGPVTGFLGTDVSTLLVINGLTISDFDLTISNGANNSHGLFYARNTLTISNVNISSVTLTHQEGGAGGNNAIFYNQSSTQSTIVDGITATGITQSGGAISGFLLYVRGPYTVSNLNVSNSSGVEDVTNSLGGVFVAYGDTADGTFSDAVVHDVTCNGGCAFYLSQGGNGTVNRLKAYNNTAVGRYGIEPGTGPAVQSGGWGDLTINNSLLYNNTSDSGGALAIYMHSASSVDKTLIVNNCTFYGNTITGGDSGIVNGNAIYIASGVDGLTVTANIKNTIFWNSLDTDEIYGYTAGTGVIDLNIDHSIVLGGADNVTGEDTYTDNLSSDPLFTNAAAGNLRLKSNSPAIDAGTPLWTAAAYPGDFAGTAEIYGRAPDIGAYEYKSKKSLFPVMPVFFSKPDKCKTTDAGCYLQP